MAKVRKSRALNFITNLFIYEQMLVFSLPRQMFVNLVFISLLVCGWFLRVWIRLYELCMFSADSH